MLNQKVQTADIHCLQNVNDWQETILAYVRGAYLILYIVSVQRSHYAEAPHKQYLYLGIDRVWTYNTY